MDNLWNQLQKEKADLERIIKEAERFLTGAPEGSIRVEVTNSREQYYHRLAPKDTHGKYINKCNKHLIEQLIQKEYFIKMRKSAVKEYQNIQKFLSCYDPEKFCNIYKEFSIYKRKWITPCIIPEEVFVALWENQDFTAKQPPEDGFRINTERGEIVRSKSEKILADKFYSLGIPYHYEKPIYVKGYGLIYPDFHVLNKKLRKEYLWEHFGLMDHHEYVEKAIKKMESLQKNGYFAGENLILTYETQQHPLNMKCVDELIRKYLL